MITRTGAPPQIDLNPSPAIRHANVKPDLNETSASSGLLVLASQNVRADLGI
jgi:hypothetical protein